MNRAVGRRPLFEDREDMARFLELLGRVTEAGLIRVHVYSLMTTHFHLGVTSVCGRLADAMRDVEREFVRSFNDRRDRDGPLVRGRFRSKHVGSDAYWWRVVRYIDHNAVDAGLAARPEAYAYGSARHYVYGSGPSWLDRRPIERHVRALRGSFEPADYLGVYGHPLSPSERDLLTIRLARGDVPEEEGLEVLVKADTDVRAWLERRSRLADGHWIGVPIVDVATLTSVLEEHAAGRDCLAIGILRAVGGLSLQQIADRLGIPHSTARDAYQRHRVGMFDAAYSARANAVTESALRRFVEGRPPAS